MTTTASPLISNKSAVPKEFNRVAKSYDFATAMSQGYQSDLNLSADRMNLKGDEHILDLCCGTGKSSAAVMRHLPDGKLTGVDNSEGMLEIAGEKFMEEIATGKVDLQLQDAMELTFEDDRFDGVFMAYGLRNMPNYLESMKGVKRVIRPGGQLCIHDYSLANDSWAPLYWKILGYGFIVPFCTVVSGSSRIFRYLIKSVLGFLRPPQIKRVLEDAGFENVQIQHMPSWRAPLMVTVTAFKPS